MPGARTAWHTHPLGQTLIVTAGCGWVQRTADSAAPQLHTNPPVLVLSALSTAAQAQSDHTTFTLPYHHFSGASAVLNRVAFDLAAGSVNADPVPIPGGIDIPPLIHIFGPGPKGLGFQGLDVEPNGITNFNGFAALAYLSGTATDSNNSKYNVGSDMRLYRGEYISSDGTHHRGTFVFI